MSYFPVNQDQGSPQPYSTDGPIHFSNSIPGTSPNKMLMQDTVYAGSSPSENSYPVEEKPPVRKQTTWGSLFSRTNSGFSTKPFQSKAWEHKLNEKHIRNVPTTSDTTRYFDRSRQTRRVFLSCFCMWLVTAFICGALAGVIAGFSSLDLITQQQKYAYNALVTGLSICLGLAFAAQFKQFCEMMRWRFLASSYRSIDEFEEVLGCDSWRTTAKLAFTGWRKGKFKSQFLALIWLIIFIAFNVFAALLGLTYSIDVSDDFVQTKNGNVSVVDLSYVAMFQSNDPSNIGLQWQQMAANLYGQTGQNFQLVSNASIDFVWTDETPTIFTGDFSQYWYRFVDLSPDSGKLNVVTDRTINSTAQCVEYTITYGGYAGLQSYVPDGYDSQGVEYTNLEGVSNYIVPSDTASGLTTWMGNNSADPACGQRCAELLVLQSANNYTDEDVVGTDIVAVPKPRLWACNNTISQVTNLDTDGFTNTSRLELPDLQAQIMAGAIGWSGVETITADNTSDILQYQIIHGNNGFNLPGNVTAEGVAASLMGFTTAAFAAMDQRGGPRLNMTGFYQPLAAQRINVKWKFAGAILAGLPGLQFLMLIGVVWFSGKAIILEPSYLTAAHLLYPVMHKLGPGGILLSVDEIAAKLGHDFKVAYSVRPDGSDPGPQVTEFVRDLDLVEQREGFGYVRGKMPEGRYD